MVNFETMPASEMLARRSATEKEIASLIGQIIFEYSRFETGLRLCVAWHNHGNELDSYRSSGANLSTPDLLKKIKAQALIKLGKNSEGFKLYCNWIRKAHQHREIRNVIVHSRWQIEAFGRHATAISTPVFAEPIKEQIFTSGQLNEICSNTGILVEELNKLREKYPL